MSLLLTNNATATAVTAGGTINLGSAVHGCGCKTRLMGSGIAIKEPGYYSVDISVSAAVTGTDAMTVQLMADGVAVPGALATATPAAAGDVVNISFPWIFRKGRCCEYTVLTFTSNVAAAVNNVTVVVE